MIALVEGELVDEIPLIFKRRIERVLATGDYCAQMTESLLVESLASGCVGTLCGICGI